MDCSPPGSSVLGILQARILEWVAISFSRGASWPQDQTQVSWIAGRFFTVHHKGSPYGGGEGLKSYSLCLAQNTYAINICHTKILGTPCGRCFMHIFFLFTLIFNWHIVDLLTFLFHFHNDYQVLSFLLGGWGNWGTERISKLRMVIRAGWMKNSYFMPLRNLEQCRGSPW